MAHILIMEDDRVEALELALFVERLGHTIKIVRDSDEAMGVMARERFDLILTDIYVRSNGVPQPSGGISLIGQMRVATRSGAASWMRSVPIVAMSAAQTSSVYPNVLRIARQVGATACLSKPVDQGVLCHLLDGFLSDEGSDLAAARQ